MMESILDHDYEITQWSAVYKTGRQYPEEAPTIKRGSRLQVVLKQNRMLEILSVKHLKSLAVHCHSCEATYPSTKPQNLEHHVASSKHLHRLATPEMSSIPLSEHARRQLILTNKRFEPFLQISSDDQLTCKYCYIPLPYDSSALHNHMYTLKHKTAQSVAQNNPVSFDLSDSERLKKLQAVVNSFPDSIALVDQFTKRLNDRGAILPPSRRLSMMPS